MLLFMDVLCLVIDPCESLTDDCEVLRVDLLAKHPLIIPAPISLDGNLCLMKS